jgi:hypothetical protein
MSIILQYYVTLIHYSLYRYNRGTEPRRIHFISIYNFLSHLRPPTPNNNVDLMFIITREFDK